MIELVLAAADADTLRARLLEGNVESCAVLVAGMHEGSAPATQLGSFSSETRAELCMGWTESRQVIGPLRTDRFGRLVMQDSVLSMRCMSPSSVWAEPDRSSLSS